MCLDLPLGSGLYSDIHCAPHACVVDFSRKQPPGREEEVLFHTFSTVHEGSQRDTGQEVVASVQESIPISVDEESPPSMLDAEGIASLG